MHGFMHALTRLIGLRLLPLNYQTSEHHINNSWKGSDR